MKLPDEIEKLKVEAADVHNRNILDQTPDGFTVSSYCNSYILAGSFEEGADWGFEQGVLHERKRAEGLVNALKGHEHIYHDNCPENSPTPIEECTICQYHRMATKALDQYLKSQGE